MYKSSPIDVCWNVLNGVGHMWFLPMLFWCFVGTMLIIKLNWPFKTQMSILVIISILSFISLPLRIGSAMYYMLFFFMGYIITADSIDITKFVRKRLIIFIGFAFVMTFVGSNILKSFIMQSMDGESIIIKIFKMSIINIMRLIYSSLGVIDVLLISLYYTRFKRIKFNEKLIKLSTCCFGIYIFQQFILKWLYYYTCIQDVINIIVLPWVGFVVTIILSLLFTKLLLRIKLGRYLIG